MVKLTEVIDTTVVIDERTHEEFKPYYYVTYYDNDLMVQNLAENDMGTLADQFESKVIVDTEMIKRTLYFTDKNN